MYLAIHKRENSYYERWSQYCSMHHIPHKIVDCYRSDIIKQLDDCDMLLWHWDLFDPKASLIARQLTKSLELRGITVFPNSSESWHYDDKIGQKYLLESINAPFVATYIYYEKEKAFNILKNIDYPKVFKLSKGSGSSNVKLIKNRYDAHKYCKKAFNKGFKPFNGYYSDFDKKLKKFRALKGILPKVKKSYDFFTKIIKMNSASSREKGYIYFQDYIDNNRHDVRVTILFGAAFAFRRKNRKNDFRASGSGDIDYDQTKIDQDLIRLAFALAKKLNSNSIAFDFLKGENGEPKLLEISYCFVSEAIFNCPGYWEKNMIWVPGHFWPEDLIIEGLLKKKTNLCPNTDKWES